MKKEEKQFIEWVEKQIEYYKPYLDINLQEILVMKAGDEDDVQYLGITCPYPYLEPVLKFSDTAIQEWKDGVLKPKAVLHELCHTLTDPLYFKAVKRYTTEGEISDERERLTEKLAVILDNLID